jgi:hypothetical protein
MESHLEHVQAPVINVGGIVGRVVILNTGHMYASIDSALAARRYRHEQDVRCQSSQ